MSTANDKKCPNCQYWEPQGGGASYGCCRRYSPKPTMQQKESAFADWPQVNNSDWCGEFEAK